LSKDNLKKDSKQRDSILKKESKGEPVEPTLPSLIEDSIEADIQALELDIDPFDLVASVLKSDERYREAVKGDKALEDAFVDPNEIIEMASHQVVLTTEDPET